MVMENQGVVFSCLPLEHILPIAPPLYLPTGEGFLTIGHSNEIN